jgi:thioredoxin-dependent peroxiredoxin
VVEEGSQAPDFEAQTDDGRKVRLSDLRGKPVVLFFYPKDETPGCTTQACGIRDAWTEFEAHGIEVFGVSRDDAESHQAFKEKFELPFPLLVDRDRALGDAFGIADISDQYPIYKRSTVVIDSDGKVAKVMPDVDPSTHADEVLDAL